MIIQICILFFSAESIKTRVYYKYIIIVFVVNKNTDCIIIAEKTRNQSEINNTGFIITIYQFHKFVRSSLIE